MRLCCLPTRVRPHQSVHNVPYLLKEPRKEKREKKIFGGEVLSEEQQSALP